MNIPDNLNILGNDYKIDFTEEAPEGCDNKLWMGRAYEDSQRIVIKSTIPNHDKKIQTLFHEIAHIIMFESGVIVPEVLEEVLPQIMANGFYQVFKQISG